MERGNGVWMEKEVKMWSCAASSRSVYNATQLSICHPPLMCGPEAPCSIVYEQMHFYYFFAFFEADTELQERNTTIIPLCINRVCGGGARSLK